ncbi:MAG TPA: hypothetical protein VET48_05560 [Steroidobacteraceae bacterium]|nr:hypothetical protein [Steroidobacteraceae bacterium]
MSAKFRDKRYAMLAAAVRKQGGKLKDKSYRFLRTPMNVECRRGHRFKITPKNIMRGLWCDECRPLARQAEFLATAQKTAKAHGGKVLSTTYENARDNLRWQCAKKHRWDASLDNVVNKKSWCPTCAADSASARKASWWKKHKPKKKARAKK